MEKAKKRLETSPNPKTPKQGKQAKATQSSIEQCFKIPDKSKAKSEVASSMPDLPTEGNIRIYNWNVNGLRAIHKKGDLQKFVAQEQPDIFFLNETKIDDKGLKKEKLDKLFNDSYSSYWNCCTIKAGYSGVAAFTKFKPVNVTYGIGVDEHDNEGRAITLEFPTFYVVATYIPNSGEGLKRLSYRVTKWDSAFQNYLETLKKNKSVIWTGDINVAHHEIDISNPKGNLKTAGFTIEERNSFGNFLQNGWVDTFRNFYPQEVKYSYWSMRSNARANNKGWRLDYFVVNKEAIDTVVSSEILNQYYGSDHCPVKLTLKLD